MAFKGKLVGVSGRKLHFGEKLHLAPDGTKIKKTDMPKDGFFPATNEYERTFTLKQDGKVLQACGEDDCLAREHWGKATEAHLSDLKNEMDVCLCGVTQDDVTGECHSIIFDPLPTDAEKATAAAGKTKKKAKEPERHAGHAIHGHK